MATYTPTSVGYHCAAMIRYRPENAESKRIEIYPTDQWGLLGEYDGPENADLVSARECLRKLHLAEKRKN